MKWKKKVDLTEETKQCKSRGCKRPVEKPYWKYCRTCYSNLFHDEDSAFEGSDTEDINDEDGIWGAWDLASGGGWGLD